MPQCDDIVVARGRNAERCRLQSASAVVKELERFDNTLTNKTARIGSPLRLRPMRGEQPLRARAAYTVER